MHIFVHNIVCISMRISVSMTDMRIDTSDLISATDLTRNTAQLIRDAAEGRRFVVMNNNVPKAALIGMADLELLAAAIGQDQPHPAATESLDRDAFMANLDHDETTAIAEQQRAAGRPMLRIPLGLSEADLRPVYIDFNREDSTHLAVVADSRKGKTTLLRHLVLTLCENNTADEVQILVVDTRRRLQGVLPDGYGHYASTPAALTNWLNALLPKLDDRMPPLDVSGAALHRREWLRGRPEVFIIVDNAHEFARPAGQLDPFSPITRLLAGGHDIGMHFIGAWRAGGVGRHLGGNGVLAELKYLNSPGIVMSGPREEGKIFYEQKSTTLPAGRGYFVTADTTELIQLPDVPEPDEIPGREVPLPNGTVIEASSPEMAAATRDSLTREPRAGYGSQGIDIPPSTPVDPRHIKPGDFTVVDGHPEIAVGPGKVISDGEIADTNSDPGTGWHRPTPETAKPDE